MKWIFARNDGGRDSGFHDAGVETFKGNFDRYLARELIQNSLDARLDPNKPVHVIFEVLTLDRGEVPGMDYLQDTFNRCAEYWQVDEKAHSFFKNATTLASQKQLRALKVGDYNTTGVPGSDSDRTQNWYHLVRCAGSSSKWGGEGGSFGIGKNAPFAASKLRTVLYSTLNKDGEHAFQGVSMLASHKLADGTTAQPTGFLGGERGESVRVPEVIPTTFRRSELGLDIVALEFPLAASWQNDLIHSVLENFWPAIDFGDLVVTIGDRTIDKANLAMFLDAFSGHEEFDANLFYRAFKTPSQVFHEHLPKLKEVSLYLYVGDIDLPKRIAMVRKTGMVIFQRGYLRSVLPFCGVFICRNEEGNRLLREMEPPRHDVWDPDHPEKGVNKKIETEYMSFIRSCIKKLMPVDDSKVISIPGLNRFLPDDDETPEEVFDAGEAASKEETPDRSPLPEKIEGRKIDQRRQAMQPDKSKPEEDEEETEAGSGEGTGGGSSKGANAAGAGPGSGGGGKGIGDAGSATGQKGGVQSKPAVPVGYRTFATNANAGIYSLIVTRQTGGNPSLKLVVSTVGDDQKALAEIKSARLVNGGAIPVAGLGLLGPVDLAVDQSIRVEIVLKEPVRVAMEVTAYEA
jgi:hypothetical protein